jgi:hypothetical protein
MFTRLRCLLRLHKWQLAGDDMGGTHRQCANCTKSKRLGKSGVKTSDRGSTPGPMTG